jgi:hypothetical protein
VLMAATGHPRPGVNKKGGALALGALGSVLRNFWKASLIGLVPALLFVVPWLIWGTTRDWPFVIFPLVVLLVVGVAIAVVATMAKMVTTTIPENNFGICMGLSGDPEKPGLTEWLAQQIDLCAGLGPEQGPLTFGQLWEGPPGTVIGEKKFLDLRMVSTCLSWARPVEMPFSASTYFYDPVEWAKLFPDYVMRALERSTADETLEKKVVERRQREDKRANDHSPRLVRLPRAKDLPIVVATRLSLSFPLLISAVPLWAITRRNGNAGDFEKLWFTDGGLCNNFPVQLFDSALPTRPTFAINLGKFDDGVEPAADERQNIAFATSNNVILPAYRDFPVTGFGAVKAFALAAVDTARNSQDNLHLEIPGYRDRVVLIKQSKDEGGINLFMDAPTVARLAERGRVAADGLAVQFRTKHYPSSKPARTGWDNHRWVRYRALISGLPQFLTSFKAGHEVLKLGSGTLPSYWVNNKTKALAHELSEHLLAAAELVEAQRHTQELDELESSPAPLSPIRRVPQI